MVPGRGYAVLQRWNEQIVFALPKIQWLECDYVEN